MSIFKALLNGIRAIVNCGKKASRDDAAATSTIDNSPVAAKKNVEDANKSKQDVTKQRFTMQRFTKHSFTKRGFTKAIKNIMKRKSKARLEIGYRTMYKLVAPSLTDGDGPTEYQDIWIAPKALYYVINGKITDFDLGRHISPIAPAHPLEISLDPELQPPKSYQCFVRADRAILFFDLDKRYPTNFIDMITQPTEDWDPIELKKNRIGVTGRKFSQS